MSERIVHKIEKHQYANFGKKTVVIYARVSTNKPSQLHSMAMQVSALTQQVYRLWHWRLADIYIDFESGASDDRSEFQRMINDCISKRYNMVLTKSVSRFGRDTLDGLNAIRKLKQHGVDGKAISTATLDTGVSYIENFAKHFNLPVWKLLRIASEVNTDYDYAFAVEMMERFELDGKKKFNHLSLGMKTMVSTIVCLSSNRRVILLDEPVLGFDAIMRVEFYDMLTESFQRHPRIIIVSTHIIEEITKTIHKLVIIDKGRIRFFDTLQAVEEKAFSVSGLKKDVDAATANLRVIGQDTVGGLVTSYIFDQPPKQAASLEITPLSLQDFFVQMVGHKGGKKA